MSVSAFSLAREEERNLISVLKKLSQTKNFRQAQQLLAYVRDQHLISKSRSALGSYLVSALVDCGCMQEAQEIFDELPHKNEYTWTCLISGYNACGESQRALLLYHAMDESHVKPSRFTFVVALRALARLKELQGGRLLYTDIISQGASSDLFIDSTLVDMYGKCGSFADARLILDKLVDRDAVAWNALMSGYADHGIGEKAWECFEQMKADHVTPNGTTYMLILKACGSIHATQRGWLACTEINKLGLDVDTCVGNTMVDMYAKCGYLADAYQAFKRLCARDVISWNALIAGYAEYGFGDEALRFFNNMEKEGVLPTDFTFACALNACATAGTLQTGRGLHSLIIKRGLEVDFCIGSSMVDMYAKCGALDDGRDVFDKLAFRDVVSWTSMIKRYGENQDGIMAVRCFEEMQLLGVKPNTITFTCLLTACSHGNLVHEGQVYFNMMREEYAIEPTKEHYGCMVDLLSRAGCVYDAVKFAGALCRFPSKEILTVLLTAFKNCGEVELGKRCFQQLVLEDQKDASACMLNSGLCVTAKMWDEADKAKDNSHMSNLQWSYSMHRMKREIWEDNFCT